MAVTTVQNKNHFCLSWKNNKNARCAIASERIKLLFVMGRISCVGKLGVEGWEVSVVRFMQIVMSRCALCPARDSSGNPFPASERDKIGANSPTRFLVGRGLAYHFGFWVPISAISYRFSARICQNVLKTNLVYALNCNIRTKNYFSGLLKNQT